MLYVSELNFRLDELKEIESGVDEMELKIVYRPFGVGKLRLLVNMERSLLGFTDMGFQEKDIDDVKGLLVDTEMSILLCTFIVSAFHILFDCLAFKNDVSYWRQEQLEKFCAKIRSKLIMTRAWTVQNKEGPFHFSQNLIKTPSCDLKQVSEEFEGCS